MAMLNAKNRALSGRDSFEEVSILQSPEEQVFWLFIRERDNLSILNDNISSFILQIFILIFLSRLSVNTGPLANGQWTLRADQWLFKLLARIG